MKAGRLASFVLFSGSANSSVFGSNKGTQVTLSEEQTGTGHEPPVYPPPGPGPCPPFKRGMFAITAFQLYPENMDWDTKLCQVYISVLFNSSLGIYNPYKDKLHVIEFPGYSHIQAFHVGAIASDPYSGLATLIIGQGNAFETGGRNISGDNIIKKFNPRTRKFLWSLNITEVAQGVYGGFDDISHDPRGNTFFVGHYPKSVMKVDSKGTAVVPWYLPPEPIDHTIEGYSGIATAPDGKTLVVVDSLEGKIYRFDATARNGAPVHVPHTPPEPLTRSDSVRLPPKFKGRVMLVALHRGGVAVLRSKDGRWRAAEYLGFIPSAPDVIADRGTPVATTQIGSNLYIVSGWVTDPIVPETVAGNRTRFPMIDITKEVDLLLKK